MSAAKQLKDFTEICAKQNAIEKQEKTKAFYETVVQEKLMKAAKAGEYDLKLCLDFDDFQGVDETALLQLLMEDGFYVRVTSRSVFQNTYFVSWKNPEDENTDNLWNKVKTLLKNK